MPNKVLVVDDSALMRRLLRQVLGEAGFEVMAAHNGREGVEMVQEFQPDVVTLDLNMPEMDGLTALSLMMQARPTPVVMVSSLTVEGAQATLEALALGAVDYVTKPGGTISLNVDQIAQDLVSKVRQASRAKLRQPSIRRATPPARAGSSTKTFRTPSEMALGAESSPRASSPAKPSPGSVDGLVLIGVSTGGPRTLEDILPQLPADFPWPVLVAQHMPGTFTASLAQRMDSICKLSVRECSGPMPLQAGQVLIAKGGADMVVSERLGRIVAHPVPESPEHAWHPSVDVLVDSASRRMPPERLVGVLLTGMGSDGAASMTRLRQLGGRTLAESSETAVVFGMPHELIQRKGASLVLPCHQVAAQLCNWIQGPKRAGE